PPSVAVVLLVTSMLASDCLTAITPPLALVVLVEELVTESARTVTSPEKDRLPSEEAVTFWVMPTVDLLSATSMSPPEEASAETAVTPSPSGGDTCDSGTPPAPSSL